VTRTGDRRVAANLAATHEVDVRTSRRGELGEIALDYDCTRLAQNDEREAAPR